MRTINTIAAEILCLWRDCPPPATTLMISSPYVKAMLDFQSCSESYGMGRGDSIVSYVLANIAPWRGEGARRIKEELEQHLEIFHASNPRRQRK